MKRLFTTFIIMFAMSALSAQSHYQFRTDAPQGFSIERSSTSGLSLRYAIPELGLADIEDSEAKGQEIILKGCFASNAEGKPNLPFENRYIAVPQGASVSVKVKEKASQTLTDIRLLPAAPLQMNNEDKKPALHWDMDVFGKDADYPTNNVSIAQATQIRGLDVVLLSVTPFRYNPVRKTLEVIYDMDIEISFEGGNGQFGDSRYRNPTWDGILRDLVINSDMLPETHYYDFLNEALQNREEGCEYLIIAPDDSAFLAWADTLKLFRTKQGILTKVATTADCGSNEPEDIRNYILNAYNNWTIPPAAVLLFGGNRVTQPEFGLKPFIYRMPHNTIYDYRYPTDNPFADMNGDSIPDLAISRMLVYNAEDCQQQVEKLINFELYPPTDPHYYDHPVITSGYEEDKWFMITSQSVDGFLRNQLAKHPANQYMVYNQMDPEATPPESIWSTGPNTEAVLDYFGPNGTQYIPASIGGLDNWGHMSNNQPLIEAMSEGGFLTFYRDHSSVETWGSPFFSRLDIPLLQNEEPTFIFSIGCLTNDFWDNWSYAMCISEAFLKAEKGAIGVIGTNCVTYSHYNDLVTWGMLDHIWPNFMPTLGSQAHPDFTYPSYSLVAGKLFLSQQAFLPYQDNITQVDKMLNVFSFMGETYLNLYTEVPRTMDISAVAYQREDMHNYTMTVEEGALICLAKGDEVLHITQGTGQAQSFVLPQMRPGEQFDVTVTKPKCIRFHQNVTIIPASGPYVIMKDYDFYDESSNDTLDFGEKAFIDLTLFNAGVDMAENTQVNLSCDSPYIEVIKGTADCHRLDHDEQISLQNAFIIKAKHDIPDQTEVTFKISLDNGFVVQEFVFQKTVSAPSLSIRPSFSLLTGDEQRTTHILNEGTSLIGFTITNTGHCKSGPVMIDFNVLAPFVTVETPHYVIETLLPDSLTHLTFRVETQTNDLSGAWLKARLRISDGISEAVYEPSIQYGGIFEDFETDTLNPFFTWENYVHYPWVYTEADAAEGQRCFEATPPKSRPTALTLSTEGYIPAGKMSFYVKTGRYASNALETLTIEEATASGNKTQTFSSEEWKYWEAYVFPECETLTFMMNMHGEEEFGIRIDNICFPPPHIPIVFAGNNQISCKETNIELHEAYAYDYDTIYWTTEGDGFFDNNNLVNAQYHPGTQDFANGEVTLSLHASDSIHSMVNSLKVVLLDEVNLEGNIIGDSIVNKCTNPVSRYSIEPQEGIHYLWQLEPAEAGVIYALNNTIDILWNMDGNDTEAMLSVTTENACQVEPVTKHIRLVSYDTPEWHTTDFSLFPNPTDGKVNMVMGDGLQGRATVEVYNLMGKRMMTRNVGQLRQGETVSLDLGRLVPGLYIVKLSTENGSCSKKVSVK